jgi:ADP-heptose:LPS heptosyltransferase
MARKRNWKDRRAWIEADAKQRAQAYADKQGLFSRILCLISKKARAKWAKKRTNRYSEALKFYTNREAHLCRKKTPEELRQERSVRSAIARLRVKEIQ